MRNRMLTLCFFSLFLFLYLASSIFNHLFYNSYAYDLGIYVQGSWLISHLINPYSTILNNSKLADHFSIPYILISLPYRLFENPIYLLAVQAVSVIAGGIPVYLIAREKIKRQATVYLLTAYYFLQLGIVSAINFDFHVATLSVSFISWALYFWYKNMFRSYLVLLILSITAKEDIPILFGFFSLYLLIRRQWKWALTTLVLCFVWYVVDVHLIMPYFTSKPYAVNKIGDIGSGWDIKLQTIKKTFEQNLWLSLFEPLAWFFVIPNFLSRFLHGHIGRWEWFWQYGVNIAPALSISLILTVDRFFRNKDIQLLIAVLVFASTINVGWPFTRFYEYRQNIPFASIKEAMAKIPRDASVSAQDVFVPHLAQRREIYLYPEKTEKAEYVFLVPGFPNFTMDQDNLRKGIRQLWLSPKYETIWADDGVYVFKRLTNPPPND